jgi:hypothetical protein
MCQSTGSGACSPWVSDPALAVMTAGVVRAYAVDSGGAIDYSEWSWGSRAWTPSARWYAPTVACNNSAAPAATFSGTYNTFVGCTGQNGIAYGGWGGSSESGTWWQLAGGVSGGIGLSSH